MKTRKLLLIAMSGVRVKDKELLALGMTLPGFVERSQVIASLPSLSLLTIAAWTPDNWQIVYKEIDELSGGDVDWIIAGKFDLVGISSFSARILDAYALADSLRSEGVKIVLGGLHVSALPDEAALHADVVVCGEGERVWPQVIEDFEGGKLRQSYDSRHWPSKYSLSTSKIPRYDLLDISRYNRLTLQTTRGCPLDCSFCAASRLISPYKIKPIDVVRAELEAILAIWPKPFIELADDNTFVNKRWAKELAQLFSQYQIRWFTETDISIADDEALLESLARSGCAQLLIGFESARFESLLGVDSRGWKSNQHHSYLEKIEKIQSYGISVNGCFVVGFDSDDAGVFARTQSFIESSGLAEAQITILTPFPGTALYHSLRAEGRLLEDVYWDKCTLFDVTFAPKQMSAEELTSGFRRLMRGVYTDEQHARRKANFRRCVRRRRTVT